MPNVLDFYPPHSMFEPVMPIEVGELCPIDPSSTHLILKERQYVENGHSEHCLNEFYQ